MAAKKKSHATASQPAATSNVPSIQSTAVAGARQLPRGVVLKRRITLPSLAMKTKGDLRYLAIADAMRVSTVKNKPTTDGKVREPATVCTVGDVLTGEVLTWIVPAVCRVNLQENYPNDSYVGKCFMVEHMGKRNEGQRYADFSLAEVDVSGLLAAPKADTAIGNAGASDETLGGGGASQS